MCVYLCESMKDAAKFVALHGFRNILVCKIKVYKRDMGKVSESFDHSERFFKCRAFTYKGDIPKESIVDYYKYNL